MSNEEKAVKMWLLDQPEAFQLEYSKLMNSILDKFKADFDAAEDKELYGAAFGIAVIKFGKYAEELL